MNVAEGILNEDTSLTTLVSQAGSKDLALWSETKKKEFVGTFQQRAKCARYLLLATGLYLAERAKSRRYISDKHFTRANNLPDWAAVNVAADPPEQHYCEARTAGGRAVKDLQEIAVRRAETILKELPPIRTATQVIMPDIAKKMDRRNELLEEGKKLVEKLEELSEPVRMSECDQKMTLGQFRKMVEKRADEREELAKKLNKLGVEGCALDDTINKALFAGLPGLSEAVITVVKQHVERAVMLDQLSRRVEEKVLFGDSEAALTLLSSFEKDEAEVSENIKGEFKKAVEALQLAGLRSKKRKS